MYTVKKGKVGCYYKFNFNNKEVVGKLNAKFTIDNKVQGYFILKNGNVVNVSMEDVMLHRVTIDDKAIFTPQLVKVELEKAFCLV